MFGFSYYTGNMVDKFSKKKLLIIASIAAGSMFILEVTIVNMYLLILISVIYGFAFILILNINGPFLMSFTELSQKRNLFLITKSANISGTSLGALVGGVLAGVLNEQAGLVLAGSVYIISAVPIMFINEQHVKNDTNKVSEKDNVSMENNKSIWKQLNKRYILLCLLYFFLGYTVMLTPYMNLYLKEDLLLTAKNIGIVIAIIQIAPAIVNLAIANYIKKFDMNNVIVFNIFISIAMFTVLLLVNGIYIKLTAIVIISICFNILAPVFSSYYMNLFKDENLGKISALSNGADNLGDSISTFQAGFFVSNRNFNAIFLATIISFVMVYVLHRIQISTVNNIENK